jgi:hypothetical protein
MIDRETAKSIVQRYLSTLPPKDGSGWAIEDEKTKDLDDVWMFCWTLKSRIDRGGQRRGMVGNYPILVDKTDGSLYVWTLLEPLEQVLEKLRHDKTSVPRLNPEGS